MSLLETLGSIIAVLLVVTIILVFWTLLWKYFLSKLKFLREILGADQSSSDSSTKPTASTNQRPSEEEARQAREARIRQRRSRRE